jgi:hypothetical protein
MGCERSREFYNKEYHNQKYVRQGVTHELIPLMEDWRHAYQFYLDHDRNPVAYAQAEIKRKLVFWRWHKFYPHHQHRDGHVVFHIDGSWKIIDQLESTSESEDELIASSSPNTKNKACRSPFSVSYPLRKNRKIERNGC